MMIRMEEFLSCVWVDKIPLILILSIGAQLNDLRYSLTVFLSRSKQKCISPSSRGEITEHLD